MMRAFGKSSLLKTLACAAALAAAAVLPACSDSSAEPSDDGRNDVRLRLNVSFGADAAAGSRADLGDQDGYENPIGDFEKIRTLRVIIVRDLNADKTQGAVEANRLVATNDLGYPLYDNLEFEVISEEEKRIYLIANEEFLTAPVGSSFATATRYLDSFTVSNSATGGGRVDLKSLAAWTVSLPGVTAATQTVKTGIFNPSIVTRLPLTEMFDIKVERNNAVDDVCYANLFVMRAAAKAAFFLNTSDNFAGTDVVNTSITAISLSGIGTTEYVFPNQTVYNIPKSDLIGNTFNESAAGGIYVKEFAVPTPNGQVTYLVDGLNIDNAEIKKPDVVIPAGARPQDYLPALTAPIYFPESILAADQQFVVNVQLSDGRWLSAPLKTNILSFNNCDAISRDTYLPILITFEGAADITVQVLPWDRRDHYVDYTDNLGIDEDGCLSFENEAGQGQTGDFLSLDKGAAQLVLNYGKVAQGSFYIASPVGATWDAYLITTGGVTDAIQFQIPDPANASKTITTTHISGKVGDGNEAKFGIVATVAPGSEQNSAQLMVIVTLANGTPVIANILKSWGVSSIDQRLTVIENPQ